MVLFGSLRWGVAGAGSPRVIAVTTMDPGDLLDESSHGTGGRRSTVGTPTASVRHVELWILGPLEGVGEDGAVVIDVRQGAGGPRSARPRAGDVLPTDVLFEALVECRPAPFGRELLQSHISRLRHARRLNSSPLQPTGYRLCVDPEAVDGTASSGWRRRAARPSRATTPGGPALLEEALAQWLERRWSTSPRDRSGSVRPAGSRRRRHRPGAAGRRPPRLGRRRDAGGGAGGADGR